MKGDVLADFQTFVWNNTNSINTAKRYYSAVKNLLKDIQFNSLDEISAEYLEGKTLELKTKNNFSAAKCGLKLLKEFDDSLQLPDESFFATTSTKKKNHRKKTEPIYVSQVKRKINQISNKKLKLAYRLALISGLRDCELAALEKDDITFNDDGTIMLNVRHGKGGKQGYVNCMKDNYVYKELQAFVKDVDGRLFYTADYMRECAGNLGIQCHDLRRIYAYTHKKKMIREEKKTNYEANKVIQNNLRHSRYKTTRRYLYGKKFIE